MRSLLLRLATLALAAGALAPAARAQPQAGASQLVVTRAHVEALHTTPRQADLWLADTTAGARAALQALVEQPGAARTWDLRTVPVVAYGAYGFTPVAPPQPGSDDPHFATATHIVRTDSAGAAIPAGYGYSRLTDDALVSLGSVSAWGHLRYAPGLRQPLPYTFGSAWASETDVAFDPPAFPGQQRLREESRVVGWGTLVTARGAEPALMIETALVSRIAYEVPGAPPTVSVDTTHSVVFVTGGTTQATVTLGADGRAQTALVTQPRAGGVAGEPPAATGGIVLSVASGSPARRGTTVAFRVTLHNAADVSLDAFDVLGRRVASLAGGPHGAGTHRATWSTADLPAGIYLVRLQAGGDSVTRRVTLVP